jgi:hypothetical protein
MADDDFGDWARGIAEDAIRESLADAEREIAELAMGHDRQGKGALGT